MGFVLCPETRAIVEPTTTIGICERPSPIAEVVSEEPLVTVSPLIVRKYVFIFVPAVVVDQRNFVVVILARPPHVPLVCAVRVFSAPTVIVVPDTVMTRE